MITIDINRLSIKPGFKILDVGCGTGRHTGAVSRIKNVVAIGTDIRFDDAIEVRKRLKLDESLGVQSGGTWSVLVSDILHLPFEDNEFDLVICSEVLEHIHDHESAIHELIRVLKPGKNIAVSVPRYIPERICWALSKEYSQTNGGHVRIYKQKELISILEKAGVQKWGHHFAHSLHVPFWWLKCLIGLNRDDFAMVNLYHQFLVWDMMKKPRTILLLDRLLNPMIGKSLVLYLRKEQSSPN